MSAIVSPLNLSLITRALQEMLREAQSVGLAGVLVERSEEIPEAPPQHGWVGIYRAQVNYEIRAVGTATGLRSQEPDLVLLCKSSDPSGGEECEERLESLVAAVLSVVLSDPSIKGQVDVIGALRVSYDHYAKTGNDEYTQMAAIHLTPRGAVPVTYS